MKFNYKHKDMFYCGEIYAENETEAKKQYKQVTA